MVGSVIERRFDVDDLASGKRTLCHAVSQTCFNRREVVLRNSTAEHFFSEYHFFGIGVRFKSYPDITVLAGTAVLLLVFTLNFRLALDRLTVLNLRFLEDDFNFVSALELVNDDVELLIADTVKDLFTSLAISDEVERLVFNQNLL